MKPDLPIFIVLLLISTSFLGVSYRLEKSSNISSDGITLYVGGDGPGNYSNIQIAIANSNDGDTIFVYNGTYYERIEVDKSINLIGEDKNTTIIDGDDVKDNVIHLSKDNITVKGFTIQHAGLHKDGIWLASSNNKITDCLLLGNSNRGILISKGCHNNLISHCEFFENKRGIYIQGWDQYNFNNTISHCIFGTSDDIDFSRVRNTVVINCTFYESEITQYSGYGTAYINCVFHNPNNGISILDGAENVSIKNCIFLNCLDEGIDVYNGFMNNLYVQNCAFENCGSNGIKFGGYLEGCLISNCIFFNSTYNGIYFTTWMGKVEVTRCHFEGNDIGIQMDFRNWYNKFTKNNFINNNRHVWRGYYYVMVNYYNNNYWDDWRGFGPYWVMGLLNWDWHLAKEPYEIEV